MRRRFVHFNSCLLAALLTACVTAPKTAEKPDTVTPTVQAAMPQSAKGRISAVSTDGEGKTQPFYGNFELTLDPPQGDSGQLMLLTPVGSTVAILGWTKNSAILRKPQGGLQLYDSLQAMLSQTIGIGLTSAMLRSWLSGSPIDDVPVQSIGPGHFAQMGWDINYSLNDETKKPKLITLKRAAKGDLPQAELKLVIDEMTP
jgi:outer membrane biogenesis lipoprotein LolB